MSKGQYRYDYGDTTKLTPLIKMHTLGHGFIPAGIHAGGLRYHGMAPLVSLCADLGIVEPVALYQKGVFEAAQLFAATEGIIPAPETSHAVRTAIDEAIRCRETGREDCILFNFSGHGVCDLGSYERYLSGELEDFEYPQHQIEEAMKDLPAIADA
jgi:tryptophan synthase beta chain